MDTNERLVADLRARMKVAGITQLDLVELAGIPRTTLTRRFGGRSPFDLGELAAICAVLDTTPAQVLAAAEAAEPVAS